MIRKMFRLGLKMTIVLILLAVCSICSSTYLAFKVATARTTSNKVDDVAKLLYADDIDQIRQTQGYHGEVAGYEGYDYTTECGDTLYSPLPGTGVVKYNARDGYVGEYDTLREQNTMLVIEGQAGTVTLLHGDYSLVKPGDVVVGGVTPIGKNASIGNSTGCHSHIVWKPNPNNYVVTGTKSIIHTGRKGNYGSILSSYEGVFLVVSEYIPEEGGPNCDNDCTTMASGDKVIQWRLGNNGIYAAACPQEWPFDTTFTFSGQKYVCRDRGGWINCYQPGDYDPAYSNMYGYNYYADASYCWVDTLVDTGIPYGTKLSEWSFTSE